MPSQAVRFDALGEGYSITGLSLGPAFTITCWSRIAVDRNDYTTLWGLDAGDDSSAIALQTGPDGIMQLSSDSGSSQDMVEQTIGDWWCWALTRSSASSAAGTIRVHYGTSPDALTLAQPTSSGEWATESTFTRMFLGESSWGSEWLNGNLAAVKVWTRALSDQEVADELAYYEPQTTSGLYAAWLFWDGPSTADASGNGRALSGGSGTSAEPGPGIPLSPSTSPTGPRPRLFLPF